MLRVLRRWLRNLRSNVLCLNLIAPSYAFLLKKAKIEIKPLMYYLKLTRKSILGDVFVLQRGTKMIKTALLLTNER